MEWLGRDHYGKAPVTEDYYHRMLLMNSTLVLHSSVDECNTCTKLKLQLRGQKTNPQPSTFKQLEYDLQLHLRKRKQAQEMISYEGSKDESLEVIDIDLQQAFQHQN